MNELPMPNIQEAVAVDTVNLSNQSAENTNQVLDPLESQELLSNASVANSSESFSNQIGDASLNQINSISEVNLNANVNTNVNEYPNDLVSEDETETQDDLSLLMDQNETSRQLHSTVLPVSNESTGAQNNQNEQSDLASNREAGTEIDNPNPMSETNDNEPDVKPEAMPLYGINNQSDLINILDDSETIEIIDDDMTITIGRKGFGKPIETTTVGLIKRQNDIVTGNLAYNEVSILLIF